MGGKGKIKQTTERKERAERAGKLDTVGAESKVGEGQTRCAGRAVLPPAGGARAPGLPPAAGPAPLPPAAPRLRFLPFLVRNAPAAAAE